MRYFPSFLILCFLLLGFSSIAQTEDQRIIHPFYQFEEGSTEYLYGDNVVFRSGPTSSSEALDTLSIGSEIQIVRKMDETSSLNGIDWHWYKVKVGRRTGYILGGLIALDRVKRDDTAFLVTIAAVDQSTTEYRYIDYRARTRVIRADGEYYGHESKLNTSSFYIEASDNRGLDGIYNILTIHLFAEACGVDGGKVYLFDNGERLIEALTLSSVADGGVFWFDESVTFPNEERGYDGAVIYKREYGEPMNDEMDWTKAIIHTLILKWEGDHFTPNIQEFEFGEDE